MSTLLKMLKDWMTENDGQSYCLFRSGTLICLLALIGMTIWQVVHGTHLDPVAFAQGCAILIAGGGVALGVKNATNPE